MIRKARELVAIALLAVLTANRGYCQAPAAVPAGQAPGPFTLLPTNSSWLDPHGAAPAHMCNPYQDSNGPLLKGDSLLDDKCSSPPGWFAAVEADLVDAHIKNRLSNQVGADTIHLPTAELDWTVSPRFELGYRFGQSAGDLLVSYRFLVTSGSESLANHGALHSRLNINAWDMDYGNWEDSLLPACEMRWRIGVRVAANFFDSQAVIPLLEQRVSNFYVGGGPHVGLDLRHPLADTGLAIVGRVESAFLIGDTHQSYEEVLAAGPGSGAHRVEQVNTVPWVNAQAGLEWTPGGNEQLHLSAGYTLERWWNYADVQGSRSDMWSQGFFFRAEVRY